MSYSLPKLPPHHTVRKLSCAITQKPLRWSSWNCHSRLKSQKVPQRPIFVKIQDMRVKNSNKKLARFVVECPHFFLHTEFQHNAFSRSRDAGKVYTRGHVQLYPTRDLCRAASYLVSNFAPDFSTICPDVPELWKRDSTCALAGVSHLLLVFNT